MKKSLLILAISIALGTLGSCKSPSTTQDGSQETMQDSTDIQNQAAVEEQKAASAEEWEAFRNKTNATIDANETRMAELKVKMKNSGKALDTMYNNNINALERKNNDLRTRMNDYKNDASSDWNSFKTEFNHDMDAIGNSLKDLTVDNK